MELLNRNPASNIRYKLKGDYPSHIRKEFETMADNCCNDLPNDPLKKDIKEIRSLQRQQMLVTLTTAHIAAIAPFLSLARGADIQNHVGLIMTTKVLNTHTNIKASFTLNKICTVTDIYTSSGQQRIENTLYTFRGISSHIFEPFICISQDNKGTQVFAYADDQEFISLNTEGSEEEMIEAVKIRARNEKMHALVRFADLIYDAGKEVNS